MKREDLKKLLGESATDELVDKIMAEHGKDVEKHKSDLATITTERDGLKTQLTEASKQIEGFKGMDIEGVKKSADEWKAKAEQAETEAKAQLEKLKFDHALDGALTVAKGKNAKAIKALLNTELLKLNDADGSIVGLKDQLDKIKTENDYLFESDTPAPKIVAGGNSKTILTDPILAAARRAAGLPEPKE